MEVWMDEDLVGRMSNVVDSCHSITVMRTSICKHVMCLMSQWYEEKV